MGKPSPMIRANQPSSTVLVDYAKFISERGALAPNPPIDNYYVRTAELVRLSGEPWCNSQLLGLLSVDLVGSVELYVRSVLVALAAVCPVAKDLCGRKQVSIAAVNYYTGPELVFAVLDHQPLSDSKAISNAMQNLLGFTASSSSSLQAALDGYDKVCHIRHAVTHQNGRLAPNNLLELGLRASQPSIVNLDVYKFQDLIASCHALIRDLNQFLFERTIERWAGSGIFTSDWTVDKESFTALCQLLVSTMDCQDFDIEDAYKSLGGVIESARKRAAKKKRA